MSESKSSSSLNGAVVGAITGDAASLGLHWLYSQERIKDVTSKDGKILFRKPSKEDFGSVPVFTHPGKEAGDVSGYGEFILFQERLIADAKDNNPTRRDFESAFSAYFGPGGEYVGWTDHVMSDLLYTLETTKRHAVNVLDDDAEFKALLNAEDLKLLKGKLSGIGQKSRTEDEVRANIKEAVDSTHKDDEKFRQAATLLSEAYIKYVNRPKGTDDIQLIGTCRVPTIVRHVQARHGDGISADEFDKLVEADVRTTHEDDGAVLYALWFARVLRRIAKLRDDAGDKGATKAVLDETLAVLREEAERLPEGAEARQKILEAYSTDESASASVQEVQLRFGPACYLRSGVPGAVYNLRFHFATAKDPVDGAALLKSALEANVLSMGDSCGRSIIVGGILGALFPSAAADLASANLTDDIKKQLQRVHLL